MQKLVELKRRIKTVENIRSVTRTLATVSSAKLSRTRQRAAGLHLYAERLRSSLQRQYAYLAVTPHPGSYSPYLRASSEPRRIALLLLAGDRGMCGGYNMAICRTAARFAEEMRQRGTEVAVVTKGAKAERYLARHHNDRPVHSEGWRREGVTETEVASLDRLLRAMFLRAEVDEVWCAYTRFHSPVQREPRVVRLLPLRCDPAPGSRYVEGQERWSYEPSAADIVDPLAELCVRVQLEDALLESYASEQGARMMTMDEATERATKTLQDFRVQYNRLRREMITTDLLGVLFASRLRRDEEVPT